MEGGLGADAVPPATHGQAHMMGRQVERGMQNLLTRKESRLEGSFLIKFQQSVYFVYQLFPKMVY